MGFKHLIIDEISMVSTELFYRFIRTFPGQYFITFVGDIDQLPPTAWGNLFRALIICQKIPLFKLTINFRIINNIDGSKILLENANELVNPDRELSHPLNFDQGNGFTLVEGNISMVKTIVNSMKNAGIPNDLITSITPYNESLSDINRQFQEVYLSNNDKMFHKEKLWYVGDRVMMGVNNYDINVMNGEIGEVLSLNHEGVTIKFKTTQSTHLFKWNSSNGNDDVKTKIGESYDDIDFEDRELLVEHILHAFCVTIHKIQGSEQTFVIIYLPTRNEKYSTFLNINLLYTAITRTKSALWIVSDRETLEKATMTAQPHRFDMLSARLIDANIDIKAFEQKIKEVENDDMLFEMDDEEAMLEKMNELYQN